MALAYDGNYSGASVNKKVPEIWQLKMSTTRTSAAPWGLRKPGDWNSTMNKRQRAELIVKRVNELAASGESTDWMSIEIKLRHEGFPEARQILDSQFLRQEINEKCLQAREQRKK